MLVRWQKLFKVNPEDEVDEESVNQLVRRCTIFSVFPTGLFDNFEIESSLPSLPSITALQSTDVSDVEYLYQASPVRFSSLEESDGVCLCVEMMVVWWCRSAGPKLDFFSIGKREKQVYKLGNKTICVDKQENLTSTINLSS